MLLGAALAGLPACTAPPRPPPPAAPRVAPRAAALDAWLDARRTQARRWSRALDTAPAGLPAAQAGPAAAAAPVSEATDSDWDAALWAWDGVRAAAPDDAEAGQAIERLLQARAERQQALRERLAAARRQGRWAEAEAAGLRLLRLQPDDRAAAQALREIAQARPRADGNGPAGGMRPSRPARPSASASEPRR